MTRWDLSNGGQARRRLISGYTESGRAEDTKNRLGPKTANNLPENDNAEHGRCYQQGLTENR